MLRDFQDACYFQFSSGREIEITGLLGVTASNDSCARNFKTNTANVRLLTVSVSTLMNNSLIAESSN